MSLSNSTLNLLQTQYYDDYYAASENDPTITRGEEFDFHRILFRPGVAVQSRELTQIQTILQAQLERHGKSQFRDGEAVLGGGLSLDLGVISGQMTSTANLVALFDRDTNEGKYIFDTSNTAIKAHVLQFAAADEDGMDGNYVIFKYQAAGTFVPGTTVQASDDATITEAFASGNSAEIFSNASIVSIDEGVYFISGFFVRVEKQTIVLNPFSDQPSYRIGLEIDEQIIDELDEEVGDTLLDPANENAPGAHRFRVKLTLAKRAIGDNANANFIELLRVVNGVIQRAKQTPRYVRVDELNDILARRTNDESGDYVVRQFAPVIETDPEDANNFILALGPGKAYVRGYEVETTNPTKLEIRKGRVTESANNRSIPTTVGNFVYVLRVNSTSPLLYLGNTGTVDIHCVNISSIDSTSNTTYAYSKIGTTKVRMIETHEVPANTSLHANNSVYKLFFFDAQLDSITGNVASASQDNTTIIVNLALAQGVPSVNGAIDGATIVLSGDDSPVTGTFTVGEYTANATHGIIALAEFLPTLPNANTAYRLLFRGKDIDAFAVRDAAVTVDAPLVNAFAFQAEVAPQSKLSGSPVGDTFISDTHNVGLLYQFPERFLEANTLTTNTATWTTWLQTSANAQSVSGNTEFTLTVSGADFSLPTGNLTAAEARQTLVIFDQTADANGRGRIVQFSDSPGTAPCLGDVSIAQVGSTHHITLTYFNAEEDTRSLIGFARATVIGMTPREKTLILGNTTHALANTTGALDAGQIEFHSLNAVAGFAYSLKTADVLRISKVLYKDSNTAFANSEMSTATDVTSYFTLDTGQRDSTYEYSRLIVGQQANRVIRPTGRLLVVFDWFEHTGRGYVTLDSYLSSTNITNGMSYDEIPSYKSTRGNRSVNLRDVLDFRPVRSNYDFDGVELVYAANDNSANSTYLTTGGETYLIPVSDEEWLGSYDYYLSRIDKICLGYDGIFRVIEGADAVSPIPPASDSAALLMFQLAIPAYTLVDDDGVPISVGLTSFEHKRFTMQELAKVEDRVAHLEYYTALNSLERITNNQSISDADGNERFKNGILVDSFHGAGVGDVRRSDFTASIDPQARELRTAFRSFVQSFTPDLAHGTTTGITLAGDMATLSYTTEAFITQPLASRSVSVNPFDVASFYGKLTLSPAVDIWKDTDSRPAQVIDMGGPTEAWVQAEMPSFVSWGEWDQTWSGVTRRNTNRQYIVPPDWDEDNHPVGAITELTFNDVETATVFERQGTAFEYEVTTSTQSMGNQVVDTSVIHNCRARDIVFNGDGLKPQANLYAYFDGVSVSKYIQEANALELEEIASGGINPFFVGQTLFVRKAVTGNVAVTSGNATVTGTGTFFEFELVAGQTVRIAQGLTQFDARVSTIGSNTALTLTSNASSTLATATLYTLLPVTVADVAERYSGNSVQYTLKVVRAVQTADTDSVVPYRIVAGPVRPEALVNDTANSTVGSLVIVPPSARLASLGAAANLTFNVDSTIVKSGVVREWDNTTGVLRLDTDAGSVNVGTIIKIVAGSGAGTQGTVTAANNDVQEVTLDDLDLDIVAGESIYSIGGLQADGFVEESVTSGRAGTVAGVFHLPGGTFPTGSRQFRLTDSATNDTDDATSAAEATYQASGLTVTMQESIVSSRSLGLRRLGPRSESFTVTNTTSDFDIQYVDPLAETFLIDAKQYPQGIFITSVDLCFASKPDDDIPVRVEIRTVVNGYPSSSQLVPCVSADGVASKALRPDQITTTDAPSFGTSSPTHTRFTFAAPVHLMPGREYAIVILSDSNQYEVYTAVLGETVIGTTSVVAKQPYAGSFFKSQNASTWTESPFEDLMFRLNRAVWGGTAASPVTGILVSRAVAPSVNTTFDSIEFYPHDVHFSDSTLASYSLDIKPWNSATDDLTDQIAIRYNIAPNGWRPLSARSMMQGQDTNTELPLDRGTHALIAANTVDVLSTLTTYSNDVAPYIDLKKMNMLGLRHLINDMSLRASDVQIVHPGAGYLPVEETGTIESNGTTIIIGTGTSFADVLEAGDTVVMGGNLEFTVSSVTNSTYLVASANVTTRAAQTFFTYGELDGNNAIELTISDGNGLDAAGYAVIGRDGKVANIVFTANGSGYTGDPTVVIPAPDAVSGYTATQTQASLDYISELDESNGNGLTRYITRPVTLADGFDARDLIVTFDAVRPSGTNFYVYYKVLAGNNDTERFDDQPWRLMTQETPDSTVSTSYFQYKEFTFKTPNERALDDTSDTTDRFKVFAIKVVMAAENPVNAPRIANFRAIALDT